MSEPYHYASAADAYGTTAHAHTDQHDYPVRHSVETPLHASVPIAGIGAYDAHSTNSYGYAQAAGDEHHAADAHHQGDEDDDDHQDEDWNVYDDFNMTRPTPHRTSTSGLTAQDAGYWDASKPSLVKTPYSDTPGNRKSLLPSEAFGFDVRNADPRRSIIARDVNKRDSQFSSALNPAATTAISGMGPRHADSTTGIELITVPALGEEFTKEELRHMTRSGKRRKKRSQRKKRCQLWVSGQDLLWGWLSPRVAVFLAFFFFVALAVLLFFVIPRVPTFAILSTNPVTAIPNGASMQVYQKLNFSMTMGFNLRADNRGGWIPSQARNLQLEVTDLNTYRKVGAGKMDSMAFKGRGNTVFQFPVEFKYVSLNTSGDQTFQDFYQGCGPNVPGVTRPTLNLALKLSMNIQGLIGNKETNTQINNIVCPFTLQNYQ